MSADEIHPEVVGKFDRIAEAFPSGPTGPQFELERYVESCLHFRDTPSAQHVHPTTTVGGAHWDHPDHIGHLLRDPRAHPPLRLM